CPPRGAAAFPSVLALSCPWLPSGREAVPANHGQRNAQLADPHPEVKSGTHAYAETPGHITPTCRPRDARGAKPRHRGHYQFTGKRHAAARKRTDSRRAPPAPAPDSTRNANHAAVCPQTFEKYALAGTGWLMGLRSLCP